MNLKTSQPNRSWKSAASLACLALLCFTGSALADNTGSGGTIVYTDTNGLNPVASPPYTNGYVVHTFTAGGTLIIPSATNADVLVVAGGGGAGGRYGCGGGAGGLVFSNLTLAGGTGYTVTVGAGGAGYTGVSTTGANAGTSGANSVFGALTTLGGGGGGGGWQAGSSSGVSGGSGGGGHNGLGAGSATQPTNTTVGFGNAGYGFTIDGYGGGGGAGAAATNANGGIGLQYNISGVTNYYAGGGGGINNTPAFPGGTGLGGLGGGGNGGVSSAAGAAGAANTGGGGGAGFNNTSGNGSSGIVIVRYPYVPGAPVVAVTGPMNGAGLVSGSSVSATASVNNNVSPFNGVPPYSVTYYYKLTTAGSYTAVGPAGPFGSTNSFTQTLGTLANGVYQIYATVTDGASATTTSVTNTFTVSAADNTGSGGTIVYTDVNGLNPVSSPPYANGYVVHKFTASGTLILSSTTNATILMVAGGGGGGGYFGCGGGAGGLIYTTNSLVGGTGYTVTIGAGGAGYTGTSVNGANAGTSGANSVFSTLTANGGGGGGGGYAAGSSVGLSGGSGGGGRLGAGAGSGNQPGGFANAGFNAPTAGDVYGGGGGAGAAAASAVGGNGLQYAISGTNTYYAGGGGGCNTAVTTGGLGGGGNGGKTGAGPATGAAGAANTGGGGGGGLGTTSGAGGSGIVIVQYPYAPGSPVVAVGPTNGAGFVSGSSISATASVSNSVSPYSGVSPYSVTYYYKLTNNPTYTVVGPLGPFGATNSFTQTLGTLALGVYQIYATVTDSAAGTNTSLTNTFTVYVAGNTGSGGTITYTDPSGLNPAAAPYAGGYVVQTFTTGGTLTLQSPASVDVLVVAGGGGGGGTYGGGGGAGGLVYSSLSLGAAAYGVTVGAGGAGTAANTHGTNGNNSVFSTLLTALGGGGGGIGYLGPVAPLDGGSGGGGGGVNSGNFPGGTGLQPGSASGGFGNNGGSGLNNQNFGGGGGAGAAGGLTNGGAGLAYAISGVTNYYAGGGGGIVGGTGGLGGGGNPSTGSPNPGFSGAANTGGGGGGGFGTAGGSGGAGIVIVRYPYQAYPPLTLAVSSPADGQYIASGPVISASALVGGGATPFTVTYYYKLTTNASYTATVAAGPFGATNSFTKTLGALLPGVYQLYATVADSVSSTTNSATNTFTVYAPGNTGLGGSITYVDASGANPVAAPPYTNGYVVQTFTANGTLIIPSAISADVLVVAGGGGGGGLFGDGGGAGGLVYTNLPLSGAAYGVTVGAGGAGTAANTHGVNGTNTVFGTLIALGGGGGGIGYPTNIAGQNGGSGGGAGGGTNAISYLAGTGLQPASASGGYGNDGYNGGGYTYGGGGGAGVAAGSVAGGDGLPYPISGVNIYYAGGGGGCLGGIGSGGQGGGGDGGVSGFPSANGAANTGGGGGGGDNTAGGKGGSGIVIVKYPYTANPPVSVVATSPTSGQQFLNNGSSISATALVAGGTTPYSVTYNYKLTTAGSYTATAAVGPFGSTNSFTQTLGALAPGAYQFYATVVDNLSGTANSATNIFTVYSTGNAGSGGTVVYTDTNGLNPVASPPYTNGYVVQTFTANDTLVLPAAVTADVLVVAGGGGGGGLWGGGGGAGGLVYSNLTLGAGAYSATVGAGGVGTPGNNHGVNGANSVFSTLTALGGGGGGIGYLGPVAPLDGGSGGGGGGVNTNNFPGGAGLQPGSASGGFGNNGGSGLDSQSYGGGGGAGAAGGTINGGDGLAYAISGVTNYYAGGGAGIVGGTAGQGGGGSIHASGAANTGGGGGGGLNNAGGNGGSGVIIVRYPYVASPSLSATVTSPAGQSYLKGSAVPATAFVAGGLAPYSVTYYYKLSTDTGYTATAAAGPFYATNNFTQTLGAFSVVGTYQVYAVVTDGAAGTATSATNTFTVSLTTGITVQDANFETPKSPSVLPGYYGWAHIADVWNPSTVSQFQQNSLSQSTVGAGEHFDIVCPGGIDWYALISGFTIAQDLLTNVNAGDTISLTFYGGRGRAASSTAAGGVFNAAFLVGATAYSLPVDTTVLSNDTWQSYTLVQTVTNSGDLSLQFSWVSGSPWLDNITVTRTLPSPASTNAYLTALGLNPNAGFAPGFTTNGYLYYATNSYGQTPTVTVTNADATATNTLIVNGVSLGLLTNSIASAPLTLGVGNTNVVAVRVVSQDLSATNIYAVDVTQQGSSLSTNAQLTSLALTPAGTLYPTFDTGTTGYAATNICNNNPLTVTVTNADVTAANTLYLNGVSQGPLTNGLASALLTLATGLNNVTVQVVSQDLSVTNDYVVAATLTAPPTVAVNSTNIYAGGSATLTATTSASSPGYLWSDSETTASITVSPSTNTTYTVTVTDGTTGCANSGSGTVTILSSTNSLLASLTITPAGTLFPTFGSGTTAYTATNTYANKTVTVAAASVDANALLQLNVNGGGYGAAVTNSLTSGSTSLVLPVNTVAVRVVSQDLSQTNTYTVNVLLQPSATVTKLTNSVSGSTLTLSWPADHLGYRLLVQTNNLNKGVSGNINDWGTVPGTAAITTTNITIIKAGVTNQYYKLVYP